MCKILCEHPYILLNPKFMTLVQQFDSVVIKSTLQSISNLRSKFIKDNSYCYNYLSPRNRQVSIDDIDDCYFLDSRTGSCCPLYFAVACNKCLLCKNRYCRHMTLRAVCETVSTNSNPYFVTLTYNNKYLPRLRSVNPLADGTPTLWKQDVQRFFKRLRHYFDTNLRYLICGEYGHNTGRPHYHFIIWNIDPTIRVEEVYKRIKLAWSKRKYRKDSDGKKHVYFEPFGFIYSDKLQKLSGISYVMKYVTKSFQKSECFLLSSRRPALGREYIESIKDDLFKNPTNSITVRNPLGKPFVSDLPKYFKDVIAPTGYKFFGQKFMNNVKSFNYIMEVLSEIYVFSLPQLKDMIDKGVSFDSEYLKRKKYYDSAIFSIECAFDLYEDIRNKYSFFDGFYFSDRVMYRVRCYYPQDYSNLEDAFKLFNHFITWFSRLYCFFDSFSYDNCIYYSNLKFRESLNFEAMKNQKVVNIECELQRVKREIDTLQRLDKF